MRALLDDAAVLDHEDLVGGADRRESVRDDDRRPAGERLGQCCLNRRLGGGVECGGCLVEDDDPGLSQQKPRDRQPLTLTTGQSVAALADHGVEAVGQ